MTVLAVHFVLGFALPLGWCLAVIATLAFSNLVLSYRSPARRCLADREAALLLGFAVVQFAVLLYLTGGLRPRPSPA